jgi:hypothetical protein
MNMYEQESQNIALCCCRSCLQWVSRSLHHQLIIDWVLPELCTASRSSIPVTVHSYVGVYMQRNCSIFYVTTTSLHSWPKRPEIPAYLTARLPQELQTQSPCLQVVAVATLPCKTLIRPILLVLILATREIQWQS